MLRKMLFFIIAIVMLQGACFASNTWFYDENGEIYGVVSDTWFYTDNDGAEYYLRKRTETRTWVGGHVVKVYPSGESTSLFYYYEWFHTIPYRVYLGDNLFHNDGIIEKGYLNPKQKYNVDNVDPSVVILFKEYLGTYSIAGSPEASKSYDP